MNDKNKTYRVLSLDGGGMGGLYTASLLHNLAMRTHMDANTGPDLDIGKKFDLIVGTSTGGIIAVALAAGVTIDKIVQLYIDKGKHIFPKSLPKENACFKMIKKLVYLWNRHKAVGEGQNALEKALENELGDRTLKNLFEDRNIALCIPAVNMSNPRNWVFKTPHKTGDGDEVYTRDAKYRLVDVCMATSAAPILFPLKSINNPDTSSDNNHKTVFADGGLWANNPILIGMIEALKLAKKDQRIEIVSVDTCLPVNAHTINEGQENLPLFWNTPIIDRKYKGKSWKGGIGVIDAMMSSQSYGYDNIAQFLRPHLEKSTEQKMQIIRLANLSAPNTELFQAVALDRKDHEAINAFQSIAKSDVEHGILSNLSQLNNNDKDKLKEIFGSKPNETLCKS